MITDKDNYRLLISKLDEFIRKYYKNQLIRGGIYSVAMTMLFYLAVTVLEYYAQFGTSARTGLFYFFIITNGFIISRLIIIPLIHLYKIGKVIPHEQAAKIIGTHFAEVKDKLLNILQLKKIAAQPGSVQLSNALINASINQKIKDLNQISFTSAINLSENRRYLKYALIPLLLFGIILFTAPSIINDSTKRLIEHRTYFEKKAPFGFLIENQWLKAVQHEDFHLKMKLSGNEIPENVFIEIENNQYRMMKINIIERSYLFKNVQKNTRFRFFADGFYSKEYELTAIPNPIVLSFETTLKYPPYIKKKNEITQNTGDLIVPAGTKITWNFKTKNTENLTMNFYPSATEPQVQVKQTDENSFVHTISVLGNTDYSVKTANRFLNNGATVSFSINVIPDLYPSIDVEGRHDSMYVKRNYFTGLIKDDYGFRRLTFNYRFMNVEQKQQDETNLITIDIPFNNNMSQHQFFHFWDISKLNVNTGDEIEYYFEVWDNDGVNGSKSAKTQKKVFKAPTDKEVSEKAERNNEMLKNKIYKSINQAQSLQKDLKLLDKKMLDKQDISWEEKEKIRTMIKQQHELQNNINTVKEELKRNFSEQSQFQKGDEKITEKQKQLEELFEKIMTDEMKELFKQLEKLLDEMDKSSIQEALDQMKLDDKDIEKELERTLELFKQLEFEQKLQEAIDNLDKLAGKQEKLSDETKEKEAQSTEQMEKQNKLNDEFDEFKKKMDEIEKKNEELQHPNKMDDTEQQQNDIHQEMKNSSEQLQKGKNKKASEAQKNSSDKMKKLSEEMKKMQSSMMMENAGEDINALREILENLVQLSFDQEGLMENIKKTSTRSPRYVEYTQDQKKLKDDSKMIEDSLFALSKRNPQIEAVVNREISSINQNMEKAIESLADRTTGQATSRQQFVMTSVNNLALILSEVVAQMQQQMAQSMPGNQQCQKPGKGKPSPMSSMKQLQEQLNRQIQQLKDGMNNPGGKKEGQGMMSMELAKLAAQQEALRNELQKINQQMNKDGQGSMGNLEKLAKLMEETETDLVNKRITQETIRRQQEILTRLLEAEKAEREREMDKKRESKEAQNEDFSNPNEFFEYKSLKQKEAELLRTIPPSLKPYYKNKVSEYFNNLTN